ncbi:restriction endonuclease PLD domain-containing protein [Planococcus salinus]|uniref:NgoFVII family restriction endonuclease n=1 Tax=Planococcus salinus TaxID=1848460 RepID=A0A3M8P7W6_9BACL|nr:restriction endonuclease PLD domain-containing protein [Planococcus salinus]RNF39753.1 NgoFVII family restriction endonuclease [Planococcus salinus]
MYYTTSLENVAFGVPYNRGYRKLRILSGYASSAFLYHILNTYPDIELELIIGMSKKDGIKRWDHERYIQTMNENPRIQISYHTTHPAIHAKFYHWYDDDLLNNSVTFVGSANFSWGGFRDQNELLVEANHPNVPEVFAAPNPISCNDPRIDEYINFYTVQIQRRNRTLQGVRQTNQQTQETETSINLENLEYVDLPLLLNNDTAIHEKSGLNWGQRDGREPNQAYIPVPTPFNRENPNFFPLLEQDFAMLTDDGQQLICVMAQANRKAIHTSESNSIMGRYFRERIGVPLGARVDVQDVIGYGRTSVRVYKIDNETYFMDYGVENTENEE